MCSCRPATVSRAAGAGPWYLALLLISSTAASAQPQPTKCSDCHPKQAGPFTASVHRDALRCQDCHGGPYGYTLEPAQWEGFRPDRAAGRQGTSQPASFDHGESFKGRVRRADISVLCGTCHSDVAKMNPYGLRTDQLAAYWVSGHGKRLRQFEDERVAVCADCHGAHDVLRHDNPHSRTHFRNVPATCARCHADQSLMDQYGLSARVIEQYRTSVHGRNLLERGDPGSPNCATCHGSHGAAPPGFAEVGHVCGQCHKQIEEYFLSGMHGRIPGVVRCVKCHGGGGDPRNHEIHDASPPVETLVEVYSELRREVGDRPDLLRSRFAAEVSAVKESLRFEVVCLYCHAEDRPREGHQIFFESSDRLAREWGKQFSALLSEAQFECARTAERVARVARGVLLVRDEALRIEDAKTELMALYSFLHTINHEEIQARSGKVAEICGEINAALDRKETGLVQRRTALLPIWGFVVVFAVLMYWKYLALRRAYVSKPGQAAPPGEAAPLPGRRRFLDAVLSVMGAAAVTALLWPAVAFVLPARKRGGARERISAGPVEDWPEWVARKVSAGGKPVVVVRTSQGFRAFSGICTHLGCIVHWNQASREFECPCHAAKFDAEGQVVSGPPPKPLPEYRTSVVQGEVIVSEAS